jgi:hypothetical protein
VSFTSAYLCLLCQVELPIHSETNPRHLQDAIDVGHLDYISCLSTVITLIMDKQSQQYPYVERPMPAHYNLRKLPPIVSPNLLFTHTKLDQQQYTATQQMPQPQYFNPPYQSQQPMVHVPQAQRQQQQQRQSKNENCLACAWSVLMVYLDLFTEKRIVLQPVVGPHSVGHAYAAFESFISLSQLRFSSLFRLQQSSSSQ